MALDAARRSSIYSKLVPLLGEDDANALMTEFPATEHDELVTRGHLHAEMAAVRAEMADLRGELRSGLAELRSELAQLEARLTTRVGAAIVAATSLLAALGFVT